MGRVQALLPLYLPWLCPKKTGVELAKASDEVNDMYGDVKIVRKEGEARVVGKIGHITVHSIQKRETVLVLLLMWLLGYPNSLQLRSLLCAFIYSCTEYTFTFFERGRSYTSLAQFWANLLYVPILLDLYGWLLLDSATLYVLLFPINIWVLEIVEGALISFVYGRNVAWCYSDYADCFCNDYCRFGHAPFWFGLGAACYLLYPVLQNLTQR